jgi:predicted SprT family Zn-dependent metalloprotease
MDSSNNAMDSNDVQNVVEASFRRPDESRKAALGRARTLIEGLMQTHGLVSEGWCLSFNKAKSSAGRCSYAQKTVTLSCDFVVSANTKESDLRNIALHEIAHALVGADKGHGAEWKAKALKIGCDGKRCYDDALKFTKNAVTITCAVCKKVWTRHSLSKKWFGKTCCGQKLVITRVVKRRLKKPTATR